jgi:hypothetical protein
MKDLAKSLANKSPKTNLKLSKNEEESRSKSAIRNKQIYSQILKVNESINQKNIDHYEKREKSKDKSPKIIIN